MLFVHVKRKQDQSLDTSGIRALLNNVVWLFWELNLQLAFNWN